jgi:[acyl-carrier-protein] S-malonyltransferase/trans-AT polyketide synthase/acyltransferase/oxidoreductase domain-containing protein
MTARPLAVVFPGQGAQKLGMARDFWEHYLECRAIFDEASRAVGYDLTEVCFEDAERLAMTEFQQPAILTAEIAMLTAISKHRGLEPAYFAGHSLGEYTALVAAGVFSLADAVRLVSLRGKLMQEAVPAGAGAMTAIIHSDLDVEWLAGAASEFSVDVGNHNALDQAALSGLAGDVAAAVAAVKAAPGMRARSITLRVSAPFHSRHMKSVEAPLAAALRAVENVAAGKAVHVLSNRTGAFHTGSRPDLERCLVEQTTHTVRWVDCMRELVDRDCRILEVGPGRPLRGFFSSLGVEIDSVTSVAASTELRV